MLWYSLEAPCRGASNEYPQHMFSWRNKKNIIWISPLICSYGTEKLFPKFFEIYSLISVTFPWSKFWCICSVVYNSAGSMDDDIFYGDEFGGLEDLDEDMLRAYLEGLWDLGSWLLNYQILSRLWASKSSKFTCLRFTCPKTCRGYSLKAPHQGASDKYPQHMFSSRNKKRYMHLS